MELASATIIASPKAFAVVPLRAFLKKSGLREGERLPACRLYGHEDIAVTGYDNYWHHAPERQWEPGVPLATVEKSNHLLGEEMVELLIQRMNNARPATVQERLIAQ